MDRRAALLAVVVATAVGGCATIPEEKCASIDWFALGVEDGRAGFASDRLVKHREACAGVKVAPDERAWLEGRRAGLVEYCRLPAAVDHGLAGRGYAGVCSDPRFGRLYTAARRVYDTRARYTTLELRDRREAPRDREQGHVGGEARLPPPRGDRPREPAQPRARRARRRRARARRAAARTRRLTDAPRTSPRGCRVPARRGSAAPDVESRHARAPPPSLPPPMIVALRIEVATLRGAREGVPHLVELLRRLGAGATFLFAVGPDHTGRALARVLREGSAADRRWRSLAYGTLLPAPDIGMRAADVMRATRDAGFETGLLAWSAERWIAGAATRGRGLDARGVAARLRSLHRHLRGTAARARRGGLAGQPARPAAHAATRLRLRERRTRPAPAPAVLERGADPLPAVPDDAADARRTRRARRGARRRRSPAPCWR